MMSVSGDVSVCERVCAYDSVHMRVTALREGISENMIYSCKLYKHENKTTPL